MPSPTITPKETSLDISWAEPTSPCGIVGYQLTYTLTSLEQCSTRNDTTTIAINETSCTIEDLSPYSTYAIGVAADSGDDVGPPSDMESATTLQSRLYQICRTM